MNYLETDSFLDKLGKTEYLSSCTG